MFRGRKRIPYDPPGQRKGKGKRPEWKRADQIFLNRRVFIMKGAIVAGFGALAARLGYMQIVQGDYYQKETADTTQRFVTENLPHLASYVRELKTIDEILADRWCADYYVPLKSSKRNSWIEVSYKKLVLSGPEELSRIYNNLNLAGFDEAIDRLTRRSLTTRSWSANHDYTSAKERLTTWKRSIDQQQLNRILSVLEAFGISGYSDEVVPNSEKIMIN